MRTIERTGQFKRDFKRESKGQQHRLTLQTDLTAVVVALANTKVNSGAWFGCSVFSLLEDQMTAIAGEVDDHIRYVQFTSSGESVSDLRCGFQLIVVVVSAVNDIENDRCG